ncbi:MAG TPA: hypothetical protein PKL73_06490 [Polyangiaceae bacterium]|jgi:hypothetical protein|nr:MAG: hypothetical protein BWY17_03156 [Deltaproteobacteria bacterium ADurb.Bin207]HNS96581.1 hypothetical protein [Polyangiaceae bacterium]HNZ24814.1 hypothetical protein [Polyangiaceae bacterium]HOD22030.1 hypothetical protein [Polyangiaceae bacterium]HOE47996.1 hypothetical protein [Polyangiaceae bacterium]
MTGVLQHVGDDAPPRCVHCGKQAAGPCASCHRMICADCCTLTESSVKKWAICLECDRKKGRSLGHAWGSLILWLLLPLGILAVATALVGLLAHL